MITDSLYSTAQTVTVGITGDQHDVLKTNTLNSTSGGETINDFSAYWLGYIAYTNVPMRCHASIAYFDDDLGIHFDDVTDTANFPCGYCDDYYSDDAQYMDVLMQKTVDGVTTTTTTNQIRLLNDNFPEYSGLNYNNAFNDSEGVLHFLYAKYNAADVYQSGYSLSGADYTFSNVSPPSDRIKKMYDVIINDDPFNMTIEGETITGIKLSDFTAGTPESMYISDSGNYKFRLLLASCQLPHGCGININTRVNVAGTFMVKSSGAGGAIEIVRSLRGLNSEAIRGNNLDGYTQANPYKIAWGCTGTFSAATLQTIADYPAVGGVPYAYNGNVLVQRRNNYTSELGYQTLLFADDVKRVFSLHYRVDTSNGFTPSYVDGVTYATDVNVNTGEFYARLKTGDISDSAFKNSLRPWQYTNFAADDFDEEDIPPYTPPSPEPPPRPDPEDPGIFETDGDDFKPNDPSGLGNGFGFTTQYAIRGSHLQEIGAKLWTGFDDINDYINNFVFAVDPDTGSVNFADIMQFFISLRAYPCPISAMASTSAGGQDMYIGSGAAPMHLNTAFSVVDSYIGNINAGSVSVPFWFGDYRDYSLECVVYLPYCGTAELNPGDIMGGTLSAYYTVDFCTGACMAYVVCTTWEGKTLLVAALPGQLGADIPMTATNAGQVAARMYGDRIDAAENILGIAKSAITGIGAGLAGNVTGAIRQGIGTFFDPAINAEKLNAKMGSRGAIAAPMLSAGRGLSAFGGSTTAYLQIRSPIYAIPDNFDSAVGQLSTKSVTIGSCSGFCQFVNVDVSGITTDADDQQAIRRALETGVII